VEKLELKLNLPSNLLPLPHYLEKIKYSSMQLYSIVHSVQSDAKTLITVNVHRGCYFFVYTDGCVNCVLFNAVANLYLRN